MYPPPKLPIIASGGALNSIHSLQPLILVNVFPFLPEHYHMTHVVLLGLPFITTVWTPVVLAIIIYATLKC